MAVSPILIERERLGVYVSVPFCRAKCSFCNFSSDVGSGEAIQSYVERLCGEIAGARKQAAAHGLRLPDSVDTVYFGGGTPSLLSAEQLGRIFASLREAFILDVNAEITLEAAPGQIAPAMLERAQRQGVNRVSLGVQSFIDREASAVGRLHSGDEASAEIARLRYEGVAEVGADLIAGLPFQTAESWARSLERSMASGATHLSVYMLEVDEDSRLGREVLAGGTRFHAHDVGDDELIADLYEAACAVLPERGYPQYEISNFAAACSEGGDAGHESRHNRKYWLREPYLGLGLEAHSMLRREGDAAAVRFANSPELHDYALGVGGMRPTVIGEREAFEETVFLGLRMAEGLALAPLRARFTAAWVEELEVAARELAGEGLMHYERERWMLSGRGRLVSNDVFAHLLAGVAA